MGSGGPQGHEHFFAFFFAFSPILAQFISLGFFECWDMISTEKNIPGPTFLSKSQNPVFLNALLGEKKRNVGSKHAPICMLGKTPKILKVPFSRNVLTPGISCSKKITTFCTCRPRGSLPQGAPLLTACV